MLAITCVIGNEDIAIQKTEFERMGAAVIKSRVRLIEVAWCFACVTVLGWFRSFH